MSRETRTYGNLAVNSRFPIYILWAPHMRIQIHPTSKTTMLKFQGSGATHGSGENENKVGKCQRFPELDVTREQREGRAYLFAFRVIVCWSRVNAA